MIKVDKHLIKAILYRIIAVLSELVTLYLLTGNVITSIKYAIILAIVATVVYYVFEETWDRYLKGRTNKHAKSFATAKQIVESIALPDMFNDKERRFMQDIIFEKLALEEERQRRLKE